VNEVQPRRVHVSHEDMERINKRLEDYKRVGMSESLLKKARYALIEIYGKEIKEEK